MSRRARPEDVDEICAALPSTDFGTSWGDVPTWLVPAGDKGRGFVLYRPSHPSAVDPVLGEQYDDLLVSRLGELSLDELTEVIHEAWLAVAPKRLCREFRADG